MFRQAFLLRQYSFICEQYFKCSDTYYKQFFFLTAGKQNSNIVFILMTKISLKKFCKKWKTTKHWKRSY